MPKLFGLGGMLGGGLPKAPTVVEPVPEVKESVEEESSSSSESSEEDSDDNKRKKKKGKKDESSDISSSEESSAEPEAVEEKKVETKRPVGAGGFQLSLFGKQKTKTMEEKVVEPPQIPCCLESRKSQKLLVELTNNMAKVSSRFERFTSSRRRVR